MESGTEAQSSVVTYVNEGCIHYLGTRKEAEGGHLHLCNNKQNWEQCVGLAAKIKHAQEHGAEGILVGMCSQK